jgi:hypothetical protein
MESIKDKIYCSVWHKTGGITIHLINPSCWEHVYDCMHDSIHISVYDQVFRPISNLQSIKRGYGRWKVLGIRLVLCILV